MDLAYLLLLKCSLFSAVFAWAWVDILTSHRAILDFIPKYYPIKWADKPLSCAFCLSGWIGGISFIIMNIAHSNINLQSIFLTFYAFVLPMAIVKIIQGNGR